MIAPFVQSDGIRDYVFPLVEVELRSEKLHSKRFRGTGFFLGNRNYALTAGHVVKNLKHDLVAFLIQDGRWILYDVDTSTIGHHPTEDIAVIAVEPPGPSSSWLSIVTTIQTERVFGSAHYYLFGYPEDAAYEIVNEEVSDEAELRPDLVYSEGHVRRRVVDVPLRNIRGSRFLELSGVAGGGCSGSPVFAAPSRWSLLGTPPQWSLTGVYIGERITDRATSVGYAVPGDEIWSWAPELLGRTLQQEATDVPVPDTDHEPVPGPT